MSGVGKGHTSILLPGARVTLFTNDGETKEAFKALEKDWRFARVALEVHDGDVETAIKTYESSASPDLVIVQTENINEGFTERLSVLGSHCREGTGAIVIGPVNDVNLYRKLVSMGIGDYLVKPVKMEPLGNDIAATLIEKIGATGSRLVAVMGAKGGVGATVLAENLAWGLADRLGQKTFLLDASGGWSTLSVGMNFEPSTTLAEAVRAAIDNNQDSLSRMVHSPSEKLTVLSSGGDVMLEDNVAAEGYEALLDTQMVTYPVLVADLSAAPATLRRTVLVRAHEIILVTTPTLASVRATRTLLQEIKDLRGGNESGVDIVVNMTGMAPKNEVPKVQIEEGLGRKTSVVLAWDPGLFIRIENEAKKLADDKAGMGIVDRLLALVQPILAGTGSGSAIAVETSGGDKKGGLGGFLDKLKAKP